MRRNTKDIQCDKTENALEDILDIEINEKSKVQDELSFDDIDKIIEEELAHYNLTVLSANVTNAKKRESTQEDMGCIHLLNTHKYCGNNCKYCGNTYKY